tara:strand:- start:458 stop:673 length:216 start_codon:yes stop_codon:yes gene_type:complete
MNTEIKTTKHQKLYTPITSDRKLHVSIKSPKSRDTDEEHYREIIYRLKSMNIMLDKIEKTLDMDMEMSVSI